MDLSIIIVNYNTKKLLKEAVDSVLLKTKNIKYEIFIIDNNSSDNSITYFKKHFSNNNNIKIISNNKNLGFAKANNIGIKKAKGKFILLLNPDTLIQDNVLSEILIWMEKNPKIGIASCALKNPDGSIQSTGGFFPNIIKVFSWMTIEDIPFVAKIIKPFHPSDSNFYKKIQDIDWVTGAFFLMRRELINKVGLLDEDYFMYTEEVDYCYRVNKANWEIKYNPKWSIIHYGGASSDSEFAILSEYKGIKLFYKKHYPKWQYPLLSFLLKIGALGRIILFAILRKPKLVKIYVKALKKA